MPGFFRRAQGGLAGLARLVVILGLVWPVQVAAAQSTPPDEFLERQRLALMVPYQGDVDALARAPRYQIWARLDEVRHEVSGRMQVTWTNPDDQPVDRLVFRLLAGIPNVYGQGGMRILRVHQNGTELRYARQDTPRTLRVRLPAPVQPGERATVEIEFITPIPNQLAGGYGILGRRRGAYSLAGWYPMLAPYTDGWVTPEDPPLGDAVVADISFYEVNLNTPATMRVASTGVAREKLLAGDRVEWRLVSGPVREFALAASPNFAIQSVLVDGVLIQYFSLPENLEVTAEEPGSPANPVSATLQLAAQFVQVYQSLFGPYPYTELDLVDSSISIGGYEFSGMVFVEYSLRMERSRVDLRWILGHEIAHQWFYGLVGSNQVEEPWLDESLATYAPVLFLERTQGPAQAQSALAGYRRRIGRPDPERPPFTASSSAFEEWFPYNQSVYYQGALFVDALRTEMGDKAFFAFMREYTAQYRYQISNQASFLELAQQHAPDDLASFLHQWIQ